MFTMMNLARLAVGLQGVGIAERATQQAIEYARERKQGRSTIIGYPDVKRMLLTMRALTRAARNICYATAVAIDRSHHAGGEAERKAADERAALLTPVAKAFSTDIGIEVASLGVQVHGGMGFIEETGAAQHYRDARIAAIYEGTNGIQSLDLVSRKIAMSNGNAVRGYIAELRRTVDAVNASNDPAFGFDRDAARRSARQPRARHRVAARRTRQKSGCGARWRYALSAAVRQRRRRLHAGERSACGAAAFGWRPGLAHRHRALLRREHRRAGERASNARSPKARTASTAPTPRSAADCGTMTDLVAIVDDGPVRTVRMNRPEKKNALTASMYGAMADAIDGATEADIRCVVIAGVPGAFSAGNDLQEFLHAATSGEGLGLNVVRFLHALARSERPLVAAVQGVAVGVGTTMLLHCDYVVAGNDTRFATPFVSLGLVPEAASSLLAPRLMGQQRAFELLVMGRPLDAAAAHACGLVNTVVAPGDVDAAAMKAAREIAALPFEAMTAARRLMRGSPDEIVARIDEEARLFKERLQSEEARAAFAAFLARKR